MKPFLKAGFVWVRSCCSGESKACGLLTKGERKQLIAAKTRTERGSQDKKC